MNTLKVFDIEGKVIGEKEAPSEWLDKRINHQILKETLLMYQANRRQGTAFARGRSEVSASRAKPWRQKGTGRARSGSAASPVWRGGGACFGPRPRDYSYSVPKKIKRQAVVEAMRCKMKEGNISIIKDLRVDEPKTSKLAKILEKLEIGKNVLIIAKDPDTNLKLSARNISGVTLCNALEVNADAIMRRKKILIFDEAMEFFQEVDSKEGAGSSAGKSEEEGK